MQPSFTAIPVNMRLVVTPLDAVITIPSSQGLVDIILSKPGSTDKAFPQWMAAAPISGFSTYLVSQSLDYYIEAWKPPHPGCCDHRRIRRSQLGHRDRLPDRLHHRLLGDRSLKPDLRHSSYEQ